jgi:hypothetical protein
LFHILRLEDICFASYFGHSRKHVPVAVNNASKVGIVSTASLPNGLKLKLSECTEKEIKIGR